MRIKKEESIALVVDYQERLMPVIHEKEKVVNNTSILLSGLRELEVPLVVTQQYTAGLGGTIKEITEAIGSDAYVEKISFSSYEDTKEALAGKKYVIVCGVEAHICVLQTVIDLKQAGYIPVLVADCVSSREQYNKEIALIRAKEEGAVITSYESILFELLQRAGTPASKKIQRLVK